MFWNIQAKIGVFNNVVSYDTESFYAMRYKYKLAREGKIRLLLIFPQKLNRLWIGSNALPVSKLLL